MECTNQVSTSKQKTNMKINQQSSQKERLNKEIYLKRFYLTVFCFFLYFVPKVDGIHSHRHTWHYCLYIYTYIGLLLILKRDSLFKKQRNATQRNATQRTVPYFIFLNSDIELTTLCITCKTENKWMYVRYVRYPRTIFGTSMSILKNWR